MFERTVVSSAICQTPHPSLNVVDLGQQVERMSDQHDRFAGFLQAEDRILE
jgi:hypothetical protein